MCIICIKKKGVEMPSEKTIRTMFIRNPDGAGYMFARDGKVIVHKGFMDVDSLLNQLKLEKFTNEDVVILHFRIGTQGSNCPELTHPYPLTSDYRKCFLLNYTCHLGICHNGIIRLTSDYREKRYNDTISFINRYLTKLIRNYSDIHDKDIRKMIGELTNSKWAFLDKSGDVLTIGDFKNVNGLLYSNETYCIF